VPQRVFAREMGAGGGYRCPSECLRAGDALANAGPFDQWGVARLRAADTRDDILYLVSFEGGKES
jgi:hypothetical protein